MMDFPEERVCVAVVVGPLRLEDLLFVAAKSNRIGPLQLARLDRIAGAAHIRSAAQHAQRAEAEGRMQAKSLEVEFMRYLAGERQIRRALEKMGVVDGAAHAVVVGLGPKRLDAVQHFVHSLGLKTDDGLLDGGPERVTAFGITAKQLAATTPAARHDLVLEAVAEVDILRP